MKKLRKLLTTARVTEVGAAAKEIILEYSRDNPGNDIYLERMFEELQSLNDSMIPAVKRSKAVSNLDEKDKARDEKLTAIKYLLQGFLHHPDEEIVDAARDVEYVFRQYGINIAYKSYVSESSLIYSLLGDFAHPRLQSSIEKLSGLSHLIKDLSNANNAFEEAAVELQKKRAEEKQTKTASEIKLEILSIINNKLVVYLRAMVLVDEAKYGMFAGTLGQMINDTNLYIKKRKKTAAAPD